MSALYHALPAKPDDQQAYDILDSSLPICLCKLTGHFALAEMLWMLFKTHSLMVTVN